MTSSSFEQRYVKKMLKLFGRFNKLSGTEIRDLTNLAPEQINDGIDYLKMLGAVNVKGKDPPYNFTYASITKDGLKLYNKKLLDGQFET